ncbi:MAG: DUF262 domain-containing protein [Candidatus Aminicenantes bacterium]|nr:DUF262 domain-containing protein [Candidatus Aminicenantes bacterium]
MNVSDDDKPIEFDADTDDEEGIGAEGLYPYDPTTSDIDLKEDPHSVFQLMRKYDQGYLVIDPEFQRKLVWKPEQQSKFIESVILNFPLPPFYINQRKDGKFIIIDGLQRTSTLHRYINNQFELQDLKAIPRLNGKFFSGLDEQLKVKIEDKKLLLYILKPSVPLKVIYDLFNRINTGGTQLSRQEVRNCIYMGQSTHLLKGLSEAEYFHKAIDNGIKDTRMKDREAILRVLAFSIFDYENDYKGDMSAFLEKAMVEINKMEESKLNELKKQFRQVMELTYRFFGSDNFRYPTPKSRGRINIAILESISYFFLKNTDEYLLKNKERILRNYKMLIKDQGFADAVGFATGDKTRVIKRFSMVFEVLGNME